MIEHAIDPTDDDALRGEIKRLGPWHMRVDVRDDIATDCGEQINSDGRRITLTDKRLPFQLLMSTIYRDGLQGKTFIDHACNCGGYTFWAKELGAQKTLGYDVRDHWLNQAEFLRRYREADSSGMEFVKSDLYDIPKLGLAPFDITWFSGILYHLPDPVTGLKIAADLTKELIYVNTALMTPLDGDAATDCLYLSREGTEHIMTGVHGLNWFPSGPSVLIKLLKWLGFPAVRTVMWKKRVSKEARPEHLRTTIGRMALVAARDPKLLGRVRDVEPIESTEHQWLPPSGTPVTTEE
ncbi:MAG: DUF1698 domain-containing protein [Lentisphaerae bacterium]|nr:DUF1698 domain-containing protein [Lentisphaerota bacterium]